MSTFREFLNKENINEADSLIKAVISSIQPTKLLKDDKPFDFGYDIGNMIATAINKSRFKNSKDDFLKGIIQGFKK